MVFDKAPIKKALPGVILPPSPRTIGFKRSKDPYVKAGFCNAYYELHNWSL